MLAWLRMRDLRPTNPRQEMGVFKNRQVMLTPACRTGRLCGLYGFLSYMALSMERIADLTPALCRRHDDHGLRRPYRCDGERPAFGPFPRRILASCDSWVCDCSGAGARHDANHPHGVRGGFPGRDVRLGCFPTAMQVRLINHAGDAQNFAASLNTQHCACRTVRLNNLQHDVGAGIGGSLRYAMPAVFCAIFALVGLAILGVAVYLVKSGRDTASLAAAAGDTVV